MRRELIYVTQLLLSCCLTKSLLWKSKPRLVLKVLATRHVSSSEHSEILHISYSALFPAKRCGSADVHRAFSQSSAGNRTMWCNLKEEGSYKLYTVVIRCEIAAHQVATPSIKTFPARCAGLLNLVLGRQLISSLIERISIANDF